MTREHLQVLELEPVLELDVGRSSARESNRAPDHPPTSAHWEKQERAREETITLGAVFKHREDHGDSADPDCPLCKEPK